MTPFSLAKVFRDLANDPSWSLDVKEQASWSLEIRLLIKAEMNQARLALMVVEAEARTAQYGRLIVKDITTDIEELIPNVLFAHYINPSHYAKVKERVKEADTNTKEK